MHDCQTNINFVCSKFRKLMCSPNAIIKFTKFFTLSYQGRIYVPDHVAYSLILVSDKKNHD